MEMKGERNVPLDRDEAWAALNDPEVLAACIPGCESMEQVGDNEFKAKVRAAVGPVNAQFKGKVTLTDITPPESYKLKFKGDGTAGFVQGNADVRLAPAESGHGTTIGYAAEAKIGGKLAQIGSRLVDGAARKMADEFFTNLTVHMGGTPEEEKPRQAPAATETPAAGEAASSPRPKGGLAGLLAAISSFFARWLGRR